jgi:hypothetical protein
MVKIKREEFVEINSKSILIILNPNPIKITLSHTQVCC